METDRKKVRRRSEEKISPKKNSNESVKKYRFCKKGSVLNISMGTVQKYRYCKKSISIILFLKLLLCINCKNQRSVWSVVPC